MNSYRINTLAAGQYLTHTEMICAFWLQPGLMAKEIAYKTQISKRTVDDHITHLKRKLSYKTLAQLGFRLAELSVNKIKLALQY